MVAAPKRGEMYWADLDPVIGCEQGSRRPVLIIQNDIGNTYSPMTIVAAITASLSSKVYPTEVRVQAGTGGLRKASSVLLNQIKSIDKRRLEEFIGRLGPEVMVKVDRGLKLSLALKEGDKIF
ncbi:MAG: PemK family transcriptional regulator [Candidatus Latescibacteria bacterium 4484_107]|nr:MAG: PemK family transcriptional regulator [Candidatus Latescibacteria bacterium 4484_107]